ncbi:MAG: di-trans,poly-cis-decaprenylcistransferase [Alphaproteobacteria bacterium]|nr:di-trans,poly-cis-decaprenylcistransferase [Alphaproteobacteria bacterium]|tara:strand:+ start:14595 stop:15326 length:732 start_codon:yes stop_codon:yes gene_type:complete
MQVLDSKQFAAAPTHVAIIMDGNGRWAKARGLPRVAGHQRGAEAVRVAVENCRELGVGYLTLYAFSSENWKRPPSEVDDLMALLRHYLRREISELHGNNVRVRFIGDHAPLAGDIKSLIAEAETKTAANTGLTLTIAINYGSHNEILSACKKVAKAVKDGSLEPDSITEEVFERFLDTADIPPPDLLIRTSGEQRLSNFLLWQLAYSELIFMDTLWPDFTKRNLEEAINEFHGRDRRYGARSG